MADILIVIPVYNHAATLRDVAMKALEHHHPVLVVDDGSTDGGADVLQGLPVRVIRHGENRGKGAALLTAARAARDLGATHMVTLDADGQHDPVEIPRFTRLIPDHPGAVLVGRRNFSGSGAPAARRFGRAFSNFWFRVQTGRSVGDGQSGFRAYPVDLLLHLPLREPGYAFEIEVLVRAAWAGAEILDVDVSVRYPPGGRYVSHFRLFRDNARLSLLNARLTMRSVLPWPHAGLPGAARREEERVTPLHPVRSLRLLLKGDATPVRLSAAGGLGVFLGALPLIGFHTVTILFASGYLRLNRIAAVAASQLCMPPLVPALCIEAGFFMRHGRFLTEVSLETLGYQAVARLYEWLIGALVVGPVLGLVVAGIIYLLALVIGGRGDERGRS
ncbi:MAG: DUF2062 domain-containing protein [Deltaproteobacteria bacterium]|nr:DUF2062 domain-containing protein [Deltaproteobacteria bacterium]